MKKKVRKILTVSPLFYLDPGVVFYTTDVTLNSSIASNWAVSITSFTDKNNVYWNPICVVVEWKELSLNRKIVSGEHCHRSVTCVCGHVHVSRCCPPVSFDQRYLLVFHESKFLRKSSS
jgi:hypothetical protein